MVSQVLVGPVVAKPEPPPVRPQIRPTPADGPVTLSGKVPRNIKVTRPALYLSGKGEIEVTGDVALRFSGDGSLWVDKASSVTLDAKTTGTKTAQDDGLNWDRFRGTARVGGSSVRLKAKGERLMVTADGQGSVTMRGEGQFFVMQKGEQLVSGVWSQAGMTHEFARVTTAGTVGMPFPILGRGGLTPYGFLPEVPPPVRVYERKKLPSEKPTMGTAASQTAASGK